MARRWRIRHKLMLGLATAIAVLALLMGGTLNGLWSYKLTIKSIDSKLDELEAAEKLNTAIHALKLPGKESTHPRASSAAPTATSMDALYKLEKGARHAERALNNFENTFKATLQRNLPTTSNEISRKGQIEEIQIKLDKLTTLCQNTHKSGAQLTGPLPPIPLPVLKEINKVIGKLEENSNDLRDILHAGLQRRIKGSHKNHKLTLIFLISTLVLSLILMICVLRYFYAWLYNPIRDLLLGVNRLSQGNFDHRIEVNSSDEMEELGAAFNDMSQRLNAVYVDLERQVNERSRQLVRSERLASVGFLAAGVAHEINNPLASIAFCSEALDARLNEILEQLRRSGRSGNDFEIFSKYLKMIQEEAFRCKNITERLLEFSRGGERKRERTDLAELIRSVIEVAKVHQNCKGKEIHFQPSEYVLASINVDEIKSVVLNLVVNALDSMSEGGALKIDLSQREGKAELTFNDTGCGMSPEVLEYIFEPFYTQNNSGKGTGLGLTITHRIVSSHGGEIEATSSGPGQGSTFHVRLPLQSTEPDKEEALENAAA